MRRTIPKPRQRNTDITLDDLLREIHYGDRRVSDVLI